jgi:UDP-N-acetyl-D-glucosamine dehydrogenase
MSLKLRIVSKEAKIGVIGLGYVGLPLMLEIAKAGFEVLGIDIDKEKIKKIERGECYIQDISSEDLNFFVQRKKIQVSSDFNLLERLDVICICVPTPLNKTKDPDISYILNVLKEIKPRLHRDELIVLESTTYPGFTREVVLPSLTQLGLKVGKDFFLAFSPERVDPGNKRYTIKNTPKVIGGITAECLKIAQLLYEQFVQKVIPVSSTDSAEMVKLLENTFRAVNIGLVNEVAIMCDKLGIDTWEVIEAAATKPFGFMPFYPGPGLGGHCIPIDPHYLSWKLRTLKYNARFIELAGEINSQMPCFVMGKIIDGLNCHFKPINGSKILVLGVSYKRDVEDIRESPAVDIIKMLRKKGAVVEFCDPFVPLLKLEDTELRSKLFSELHFGIYDCVAILTDHTEFNYAQVVKEAKFIVDTRNAIRGFDPKLLSKVVKL